MKVHLLIRRAFCKLLLLSFVAGGCGRASYTFQAHEAVSVLAGESCRDEPALLKAAGAGVVIASAASERHHSAPAPSLHRATLVARIKQPKPMLTTPAATSGTWARTELADTPAAPRAPVLPEPSLDRSKGVALLLALFLGIFGLHLFYLGHRRRGFLYLLGVLLILTLSALAVPVANSVEGGNGWAGVMVGLTMILGAVLIVAGLVVVSLVDAVSILTGGLQPVGGTYYPRFFQTRPTSPTQPVEPTPK